MCKILPLGDNNINVLKWFEFIFLLPAYRYRKMHIPQNIYSVGTAQGVGHALVHRLKCLAETISLKCRAESIMQNVLKIENDASFYTYNLTYLAGITLTTEILVLVTPMLFGALD